MARGRWSERRNNEAEVEPYAAAVEISASTPPAEQVEASDILRDLPTEEIDRVRALAVADQLPETEIAAIEKKLEELHRDLAMSDGPGFAERLRAGNSHYMHDLAQMSQRHLRATDLIFAMEYHATRVDAD